MTQRTLPSNPVESIAITAVIDTALCVGAGGSSGSLADKPIVRTAEGRLLIPASQLKGRLRHECEKLARGLHWHICESPNPQTMCPQRVNVAGNFQRSDYRLDTSETSPDKIRYHCLICQIFGNPAMPSRIVFDDLICTEDPQNLPEVLRPGVTLNRRRRVAEEKKLYFLETSPANAQLQFTGELHFQTGYPDCAKALVKAGLCHIQALGGSKSAGLGWLHWEHTALQVNERSWSALLPQAVQ